MVDILWTLKNYRQNIELRLQRKAVVMKQGKVKKKCNPLAKRNVSQLKKTKRLRNKETRSQKKERNG